MTRCLTLPPEAYVLLGTGNTKQAEKTAVSLTKATFFTVSLSVSPWLVAWSVGRSVGRSVGQAIGYCTV